MILKATAAHCFCTHRLKFPSYSNTLVRHLRDWFIDYVRQIINETVCSSLDGNRARCDEDNKLPRPRGPSYHQNITIIDAILKQRLHCRNFWNRKCLCVEVWSTVIAPHSGYLPYFQLCTHFLCMGKPSMIRTAFFRYLNFSCSICCLIQDNCRWFHSDF